MQFTPIFGTYWTSFLTNSIVRRCWTSLATSSCAEGAIGLEKLVSLEVQLACHNTGRKSCWKFTHNALQSAQRAQIRAGESQEGRPLRRHRKHEQSLSFCTNASLAKVTALKDGKKCRRRNSWQQNHTFMTARRGSLASSHWTSWQCQSSPLLLLLARKDMGAVVVQRFL